MKDDASWNATIRATATESVVRMPQMFVVTSNSPTLEALKLAGIMKPSSGALAVQVALSACNSTVDLYGFSVGAATLEGTSETHNFKYHYYDQLETVKRKHK